jgi:hypothetical protein
MYYVVLIAISEGSDLHDKKIIGLPTNAFP